MVNKEKGLLLTSLYLDNAIFALKKIPCECKEDNYCDICCLIDDVISIKHDIDKELQKLIKS